jgi:CRP-like cAMP-binding protein
LRLLAGFRDFDEAELAFMGQLKLEHRRLPPGADLFEEGEATPHLFTVYSGWAYRYRRLHEGRRQILGVVLPGDLVGLHGVATGRQPHGLRTVTAAEFCVLSFARLPDMLREQGGLALRLLWLASHEQVMLERLAVTLGRCSAEEALASFVLTLRDRLDRRGLLDPGRMSFGFPLSQAQVADHLGMTVVHLNRVLRRMEERNWLTLRRGRMEILDEAKLRALACLHAEMTEAAQPLM